MKFITNKKWRIATPDFTIINELHEKLHINRTFAQILCNRKIDSQELGNAFLYDDLKNLEDPFLLKGMGKAISRIYHAVNNKEKIVVYGDYDVDGITATSLLYRFFSKLNAEVEYYIPERQSEGYGLNLEALEHLISLDKDLIITVDCGISSVDLVAEVKDRIDLIITDHHNSPEIPPPAYAVINPKQPGCNYPDKNLSGVGVAFKICQAYYQKYFNCDYTDDLDIVALGTVADIVPLLGENRIFVREGLKKINNNPQLGIANLLEVVGLKDRQITAGNIAFSLAPRLNAAGRLTHATEGVKLLVTTDDEEARDIAQDLHDTNTERQLIEREILALAENDVIEQGMRADKIIVVVGDKWHSGVIGIVASRLVETFYKPTLIISVDENGIGKASCRSIEGFDMYDALTSVKDLFIQYGGHKQAAGFSIEAKNIEELHSRLVAYAEQKLKESDYIPIVDIDSIVDGEFINIDNIKNLSILEPYGMSNPTPTFGIEGVKISNIYLMGQDKQHVKFVLEKNGQNFEAISWFGRHLLSNLSNDQIVKIAFSLQLNEWQGITKPQLIIQDIQPVEDNKTILTKEGLREAYIIIKKMFFKTERLQNDIDLMLLNNNRYSKNNVNLLLALEVFKELGIIDAVSIDDEMYYRWCHITGKLDLFKSVTFLKHSV